MIPSHTIEALRARAVWRLSLAATVASLLAFMLYASLLFGVELHESLTLGALLVMAIAALPVACGGGWVMHRAARQRSRLALSGASTLGCVLLALVTSMAIAVYAMCDSNVDGGPLLIIAIIAGVVFGTPMGLAFGLVFLSALAPALKHLEHPAQDTPAVASLASALMLMFATVAAWAFASSFSGRLASLLESAANLHIPARTCALLLTAPFALSALVGLAVGLLELRSLHRLRSAILNGTHPEYYPGDIPPDDNATPLTERDRLSAKRRLVIARTSGTYRDGTGIPVFVGVR